MYFGSLPGYLHHKEFLQRYLIRVRAEFDGLTNVTLHVDKSKVGTESMTLPYIYSLQKHLGAVLPLQALYNQHC